MIRQLSYKQKLQLLGAALVLALLLCYQLAIRQTIAVYRQYRQNYIPEEVLQQKLQNYDQLKKQESQLNQLFHTAQPTDSLNDEQLLLRDITGFSDQYHVHLKNYSPFNMYYYENMHVVTRIVAVEGGFHRILRFINDLESSKMPGRICATVFKSYEEPGSDTTRLSANLYLQQLILLNDSTHATHP